MQEEQERELKKLRENEEILKKDQALAADPEQNSKRSTSAAAATTTTTTSTTTTTVLHDDDDPDYKLQIPEEELKSRFRARGQPIRMFGETSGQRIRRLKLLESMEERTEGQRNDFRSLLIESDKGLALNILTKQAGIVDEAADEKKRKRAAELASVDTTVVSPKLLDKDPDRTRYLIGVYFKRMLLEWSQSLDERPEDEKRSTQGRLQTATAAQSTSDLAPFFKSLSPRTSTAPPAPDILARVTEICMYMQEREYLKANDSYLRLSIGNAPWPIGVTMVGIHERSAREKISSSQVAHALNDEAQRKWIQAIKRLMTFTQKKYPPSDLGKAIG